MDQSNKHFSPRNTFMFAMFMGAHAISVAQSPAPAATVATERSMFVSQVDREDLADLSARVPAAGEIAKGLFPEEVESPEKRAERERCERILSAGYKCMPPARSYTRYSLPGVSFSVGSSVLPDAMKSQLGAFAEVLKGRQTKSPAVRIDGHADATGSADANLALSQRRAESVREYLVSLGVSPALLSAQGFGSRNLRNPQDPASGENRRVEIARNLEPK